MIEIRLPKLGTGEVGSVIQWHVSVGDPVKEGQVIAAVETEKVNTDVESPVAGLVARLLISVDEEVAVGTVIALIEPTKE